MEFGNWFGFCWSEYGICGNPSTRDNYYSRNNNLYTQTHKLVRHQSCLQCLTWYGARDPASIKLLGCTRTPTPKNKLILKKRTRFYIHFSLPRLPSTMCLTHEPKTNVIIGGIRISSSVAVPLHWITDTLSKHWLYKVINTGTVVCCDSGPNMAPTRRAGSIVGFNGKLSKTIKLCASLMIRS